METKSYQVFKFDELSEEAQQKAVENHYDINIDHQWWEFIYADAKNIGLKIEGFDIDRASYCKGTLCYGIREVMNNIIKEHGEGCETHRTAIAYLQILDALAADDSKFDEKFDQIEYDFEYALKEDYRVMLSKEYEYLTSKESIIKTIKANDYDFLANGKID